MKMWITKERAASSQLDTAICLYFKDRHPVAIHTLTCAAYELLWQLHKKRGGEPVVVVHQIRTFLPKEEANRIIKRLKEPQNFFKHADNDPIGKVISFNPTATEFFIYEAIIQFAVFFEESTPIMRIYAAWFICDKPSCFNDPDAVLHYFGFDFQAASAAGLNRAEFFEKMQAEGHIADPFYNASHPSIQSKSR